MTVKDEEIDKKLVTEDIKTIEGEAQDGKLESKGEDIKVMDADVEKGDKQDITGIIAEDGTTTNHVVAKPCR